MEIRRGGKSEIQLKVSHLKLNNMLRISFLMILARCKQVMLLRLVVLMRLTQSAMIFLIMCFLMDLYQESGNFKKGIWRCLGIYQMRLI